MQNNEKKRYVQPKSCTFYKNVIFCARSAGKFNDKGNLSTFQKNFTLQTSHFKLFTIFAAGK